MTRLPAEWEPQAYLQLTWPRRQGAFDTSEDDFQSTLDCFRNILSQAAKFAAVLVSACPGKDADELRAWLAEQQFEHPVRLYECRSDDVWVRDHGPIGVQTERGVELLDFRFNGWGGKFPAQNDDVLCQKLAQQNAYANLPLIHSDLILEGGALETDGQGSLLATRSSVLNDNRNAGLSQQDIEAALSESLGISRFLWLQNGHLIGDDTDGHIDTLVRFADENTLVWQSSGGPQDVNHASLTALHEELQALRTQHELPYRLIALPYAGLHIDEHGDTLPASYANYLILNQAILLPTYGVENDQLAQQQIQQAYPQHQVITIDCRALIRQYGSLHCATMNIPA